ncbi:hypothetical protein [uncultured Chloroflexus sp.]|uniref:hypothetical protein n=1 Tax=uncultured Chloroflexus sp. TaxID=214040 RepID=UPI00262378AD|nr:hypothetical protein [uncultured Chloroflexus sp.]
MNHHLTPLQRLAVEAIQEDERLTAGLDDAQAGVLLRWATARAAELTCDAADEVAAEAVAQAIRTAVRAAVRADGAVATAERALAQALPTGVASSLPTSRTLGGAELAAVSLITGAESVPDTSSDLSYDASAASPSLSRPPRLPRRWPEVLPLSLLAHLGRR